MNEDKLSNDGELICPITFELFRDPVLATDGHVYEREAITRWIHQHGTSPFTRQTLLIEDLCSDDHLKELADRRRNSTVIYTINTEAIQLPSLYRSSRNQRNATVYPHEPGAIIRSSDGDKKSWVAACLIILLVGGVLSVSLLLIITKYELNKKINALSVGVSNPCLHTSRVITLLILTNSTRFNYTYYSYSYKAMSSNDTILFSFLHDWCLDDLAIFNINSRAKLICNGGFESGVLEPFRFCSKYNYSRTDLSRGNSNQRSGLYAFCHRSISRIDYLFQNFNTTEGQIYNVSFWIKNRNGSKNIFTVAIIA